MINRVKVSSGVNREALALPTGQGSRTAMSASRPPTTTSTTSLCTTTRDGAQQEASDKSPINKER